MKKYVQEDISVHLLWQVHDISFHHFLKKKGSAAIEKGSADIKIKFNVAMRI